MQLKLNRDSVSRFLFWLVLFLPTVLALWHSNGNGRTWQTLLWAGCATALPAVLPRIAFIVAQWIGVILLPFLLCWITYAALNGIGPNWEVVMAVMTTSPDEAWGAIKVAIRTPQVVLFSFVCCLCLGLSIQIMYKARSAYPMQVTANDRLKLIFALTLMPFFISFSTNASGIHFPVLFMASDPAFSPLGTATRLIWDGVDQVLYGDILNSGHLRNPATATRKVTEARLAIFVVGESMRPGGIGPNTIQRGPWSKALNERVKNNLGAWLPTTCAGSNGTAVSVPLLLTGLTPKRYDESGTAPSILAVLKKAGYKTAWISNQDNNIFSEQGHDYYWKISRSASVSDSFDEQMIPVARAFAAPLQSAGQHPVGPYAMILHLHGSHFEYVDRYPVAQFSAEPDNVGNEALTELRYTRSEEYTAKVINDLAGLLDATPVPSFLVYSSDHGENLASDHNGVILHLGPRATLKDGNTTSFVFWNRAMALTGKPAIVLNQILSKSLIAHVDVSKIYLALAGMNDGPVIPETDPQILAPTELNGPILHANSCALLQP